MSQFGKYLRKVAACAVLVGFAGAPLAHATPGSTIQQAQEEHEPAQSSGIVTPGMATGFIKVAE